MNFLKAHFTCEICSHTTDIYFENSPSLEDVREKVPCTSCGEVKYCNAGDLGYRTEWPDPDYAPWQLQCLKLSENKYVCKDCWELVAIPPTFQDLVAVCPICEQASMKIVSCEEAYNTTLDKLLQSIHSTPNCLEK